jgi:Raf kinase inhibitor-like YbhB/YbcL family protein
VQAILEGAMRFLVLFVCLIAAIAPASALELQSPDTRDGAKIAEQQVYTRCGGSNVSPSLRWSGVPAGTKSLAVTLIDISVGPSGWSHWIVVNLPAVTTSLARGVSALPPGASLVRTNFGDAQYDGPCPPQGSGVHRYQFTVWALKASAPAIAPDANASSVMTTLQGLSLAKASLTGTYQR